MTIQTVTGETLAEFNEAKLADPFAAAEKEAEKAEERAKAIKAEEAKAEKTEEPEEVEKEPEVKEEKPKKGKLAERFSEITAARNAERTAREAAEARAAELAAKLEAYEKPKVVVEEKKAPDPKDYSDFDDYTDAVAEYKAEQKLAARAEAEKKAKEEARAGEITKAWETRIESAKERYEDFHDIITSSPLQYEPVVRKVIMESEFGPDILYHLSHEDKDAEKFAKMDVDQRIKFIGRLEGKFEDSKEEPSVEAEEKPAKVEKPKVKLPTPITPIKAKSTSIDPINAPGEWEKSYAEYKAARNKQRSLQ